MAIEFVIAFLVLGIIAGLLAGLLGLGGGIIVVPSLVYLLPKIGVADNLIMPMALGTSFATIVVTTFSAAQQYAKQGNIEYKVIKFLVPALMIMGLITTSVVTGLSKSMMTKIFSVILLYLSVKMFLSLKTKKGETKPLTPQSMITAGSIIGVLASLAGIAGGSFIVPFLDSRGLSMKKAIGTAALCGCLLGISGMLSFIYHGWNNPDLPDYSLGYVYLPALLAITGMSFFTSKIGAKLANTLPVATLKKVFSVLLVFIAINMFFKY